MLVQLLRKAHGELQSRLSPPRSVDPLTVLPPELAETVLEYLSFRQRINACLVSKSWAHFIRSTPILWKHLDLSGAKRKVPNAFISRAINCGRKSLVAATLDNLFDLDKALPALLRVCPLEQLTVRRTVLLGDTFTQCLSQSTRLTVLRLSPETNIALNTHKHVLRDAPVSVELMDLQRIPRFNRDSLFFGKVRNALKTLKLGLYGSHFWDEVMRDIQAHAPNLQSLTVDIPSGSVTPRLTTSRNAITLETFSSLRHLDLQGELDHASDLHLPSSLTSLKLKLNSVRGRDLFQTNSNLHVNLTLPYLEELFLDLRQTSAGDAVQFLNCYAMENTELELAGCDVPSKLRVLAITSAEQTSDCLPTLLSHPRLQDLRCLTLCNTSCKVEAFVPLVVETLQKLEFLDVSGSDITGIGVKQLVQAPLIRHLVLNDCRFLGRDAVEWARSQGVRVDFRMSITDNGGRKVRY